MGQIMTVEQAAERLGVTARTVQLWIKGGKLPGCFRLDPSNRKSPYRVPVETVERFEQLRKDMGNPSA